MTEQRLPGWLRAGRPGEDGLRCRPGEAEDFLDTLWGLYSGEYWYEVRVVGDRGARSRWFRSAQEASTWLARAWRRSRLWERHVYHGVLPRAPPPDAFRDGVPARPGRSSDVREAAVVFADLDYKEEAGEAPRECRERLGPGRACILEAGEDGRLEAYVSAGGKLLHIQKPGLDEFMEWLGERLGRLGVEPGLVVDSGYGYHVYVLLDEPLSVEEWRRLQSLFITYLGGDPKTRDPARVLRLPGTWNPRFSPALYASCRLVYRSDAVAAAGELLRRLEALLGETGSVEKGRVVAGLRLGGARRRLRSEELEQAARILAEYWVPGHRNNLELGLVGWLWKSGVDYESARRLLERIVELAGDEEASKRLGELDRQWRLFETGAKQPSEIKGKTGVVEALEELFREKGAAPEDARDRALAVVTELERFLGPRRSILIRSRYETGVWFVNDPSRGIVLLREKQDSDGEVKRHRRYISSWYLEHVLVAEGAGDRLYRLRLRNARTGEDWVLEGDLEEVARRLTGVHGVKRRHVVADALSSLVEEFIARGLAETRAGVVAGLVPVQGSVKAVYRGVLSTLLCPEEPDREAALEALRLLARIRCFYDPAKFDAALRWAGYAAAAYPLKKLFQVKQVYLFLHGDSGTGKTTLGRILSAMFPLKTRLGEMPEEAESEYRLAFKLDAAATIVLEDEVQGISQNRKLLGLLKRAATGDAVRWRGDSGRVYHARASLVMTSNYREVIADQALASRILAVEFTSEDSAYRKPREQREEFRRLLKAYTARAPHLGSLLLRTLEEDWDDLVARGWPYRLLEKQDYLEFGAEVWRRVAARLGAEPPPWTGDGTGHAPVEDSAELDEYALLVDLLHDAVRDAMAKFKTVPTSPTLAGRLKELYEAGCLPSWLRVKDGHLALTAGLVHELEKRYNYKPIGGLKGLAGRLGYQYKTVRLGKKPVKAMLIPLQEIQEALETPEEQAARLAEKYQHLAGTGLSLEELARLIQDRERVDPETARLAALKIRGA